MIGIYGGTFDPVHYGHLRTALDVQQALNLEQIRFIPCSQPAHRDQPGVTAVMRLQMLQLAIEEQSEFVVDTREMDRQGPSYMVDTLKSIRAEIGQQPLVLIIGADAFKHLAGWHQWQSLFDYAHVLVMSRPGSQHHIESEPEFFKARLTEQCAELTKVANGYLYFQNVTRLDISATRIRQMIADEQLPQFLLPDPVIDFINTHQLYR
jgi:nicotinate-nucleotide adenylyltransferase